MILIVVYLLNKDFDLCVINEFILNMNLNCEWVNNLDQLNNILNTNILENEKLIGIITYFE